MPQRKDTVDLDLFDMLSTAEGAELCNAVITDSTWQAQQFNNDDVTSYVMPTL